MTDFKKLIWRVRYAAHLSIHGGIRWSWAWDCSKDAVHDFGNENPAECANGELSCWSE